MKGFSLKTRGIAAALLIVLTLPLLPFRIFASGGKVIEEPTALRAEDFVSVSGGLTVRETEGDSFIIDRTVPWVGKKTSANDSVSAEVTVDLDKTPVLFLTMGACGNQYDAFYEILPFGGKHYINNNDAASWRWSGSYRINLAERHNLSGKVVLRVTIQSILYEAPFVDLERYSVNVKEIGFGYEEDLSFPAFVGDGMVFQQNTGICVPGTAKPGASVSAVLTDSHGAVENASAKADENGSFLLTFGQKKGGYDAYTLTVTDGETVKTFDDVLVGEVWLTGGQSNMEYQLRWTVEGNEMGPEAADDPYLRCICFGTDSVWAKADSYTGLRRFNAVGYYFAKELRRTLGVPVAVVDSSHGGSSIYQWLGEEILNDNPDLMACYKSRESAYPRTPQYLYYDQRIVPLTGFRFRGLVWYQGEANVGDAEGTYAKALTLLRESWGRLFGFDDGKMPMIVTHLAPYLYGTPLEGIAATDAEFSKAVREMGGPAAEVTVYDLPLEYKTEAQFAPDGAVHPAHKEALGKRLAASASALLYGADHESTAPVLKSFEAKNGAVYLTFDHVGDGLKTAGTDTVRGFCVCAADGVFYPADAVILSGDTVRVTSDYIENPVGASYAYTTYNMAANLYGTDGNEVLFPVVPFRTPNVTAPRFFHTYEWTYCDGETIWRGFPQGQAEYCPAWETEDGVISFSETDKVAGTASLKLDYHSDGEGLVTLCPNVSVSGTAVDYDADFSNCKALRLYLKADGTVSLKAVRINDGEIAVNEKIGSEWTAVNVDLSGVGERNPVKDIGFVFETDPGARGTLYLDEITFGADAASYHPYVSTEEADTADSASAETTDVQKKTGGVDPVIVIAPVVGIGIGVLAFVITKKAGKKET